MAGNKGTFKGWYPDEATGGTKYWDGYRWTGDVRPPRRKFAAKAHEDVAIPLMLFGAGSFIMSFFASDLNDGSVSTFSLWAFFFLAGVGMIAGGVYGFRGQGPTDQAIQSRLAEEEKTATKKRFSANIAGAVASVGRFGRPQVPPPSAPPSSTDGAAAAQIKAISNPQTAKALADLQNLLYTRTLTEQEFKDAKNKLLGKVEHPQQPDQFAQLEKLADLHRQGVLGDVEFAAAKARVLGL